MTQTHSDIAGSSRRASARETRDEILAHRKTLAAALFNIYYLTEDGRRPVGWKATSMAEAFEILERPATGERERARLRFLALGRLREHAGSNPELSAAYRANKDDFLPYAVVDSTAKPIRGNETAAEVKVLANLRELGQHKFLHIARAVDPRAWIETGFFSDMYRIDWRSAGGVPVYDAAGYPCRHPLTNAQPLGELWFGTGEPGASQHPDRTLLDLVFEGFDLQGMDGSHLSTFNNIFGIERFAYDSRSLELRFRLYRSINCKLEGLPRKGGMDKNDGALTAKHITADELVAMFNEHVPSVRALLALKAATSGENPLVRRIESTLAQLKLDPDIEKSARALAEDCVLVTATKHVHFTDLTPQGEPFIDLGEILNYGSPLVLKPFFEQLLLLGACARPSHQLRGIVDRNLEG